MKRLPRAVFMEVVTAVSLVYWGGSTVYMFMRRLWGLSVLNLAVCVILIGAYAYLNIHRLVVIERMQKTLEATTPMLQILTRQALLQWGTVLGLLGVSIPTRMTVRQASDQEQEAARKCRN